MEKTEYAELAGDTRSFSINELKQDFIYIGFKNINIKLINCIHPAFSGKLLQFMIKIEPLVEKIPILNLISGSIVIYGEND